MNFKKVSLYKKMENEKLDKFSEEKAKELYMEIYSKVFYSKCKSLGIIDKTKKDDIKFKYIDNLLMKCVTYLISEVVSLNENSGKTKNDILRLIGENIDNLIESSNNGILFK